jgi:hypothetical protein
LAEVVRVHELPVRDIPAKQPGRIGGFASHWGRRAGADGRRLFGMRVWF